MTLTGSPSPLRQRERSDRGAVSYPNRRDVDPRTNFARSTVKSFAHKFLHLLTTSDLLGTQTTGFEPCVILSCIRKDELTASLAEDA